MMMDKPHLINDEEPEILMCVNVEQMKALYASVRGHCRKCQSPVWVSESGQKVLRQNSKLQVYCMECAMERIKEDKSGEKPTLKAVPGALEELRRYLAKVGDN